MNSAEEFIKIWQKASSSTEAAKALGITQMSACTTAYRLRKKGVPLKKFSAGRRGGDYAALAKIAKAAAK